MSDSFQSIMSLMDNDNGYERGIKSQMGRVWDVIRTGPGLRAVDVQALLNRPLIERRPPRGPFPAKDLPRLQKRGNWQLPTVKKHMWSLWQFGLIEKATCPACPECGEYHVEDCPVYLDSGKRRIEGWQANYFLERKPFTEDWPADQETCCETYNRACAWWNQQQSRSPLEGKR
jgi:hypothetical protein